MGFRRFSFWVRLGSWLGILVIAPPDVALPGPAAEHRTETRSMTQDAIETVTDREVDRKAMEALIERAADNPLSFQDCDFQGADFSRLDLRGAHFTACAIANASFQGATLADTSRVRCRASGRRHHLQNAGRRAVGGAAHQRGLTRPLLWGSLR
ncbi:hypothetical protein D9M72_64100 [compost metagenome]